MNVNEMARLGGKARWKNKTPAQKSEHTAMMAKKRWAKTKNPINGAKPKR